MTLGLSVPNTTAGDTLFPSGSTLLPPDPLAPEFGLHLCNDYMAPAYRRDDIVLVRALRTDERVTPGADYLFAQRDHKTFGQTLVLLGRLTCITKTLWICDLHNGMKRRLPRAKFPLVYVVVGNYRTSNPALKAKVGGDA